MTVVGGDDVEEMSSVEIEPGLRKRFMGAVVSRMNV